MSVHQDRRIGCFGDGNCRGINSKLLTFGYTRQNLILFNIQIDDIAHIIYRYCSTFGRSWYLKQTLQKTHEQRYIIPSLFVFFYFCIYTVLYIFVKAWILNLQLQSIYTT